MTDETKHAPTLEWRYVPSHVAEGPSEVRHKDGWLVCETCSDSYARLMASSPDLVEALKSCLIELSWCKAQLESEGYESREGGSVCEALRIGKEAVSKAEGK